jgi:hypothetical protein
MIIRECGRKAERQGKQTRGLRRELRSTGVCAAHDHHQLGQGRIGQLVALQKGIETAEFPPILATRCTFEVLMLAADLNEPALQAIAEIAHDIDLKDAKFSREQTASIVQLISGISISHKDDFARIERGAALFDDLYAYFHKVRR